MTTTHDVLPLLWVAAMLLRGCTIVALSSLIMFLGSRISASRGFSFGAELFSTYSSVYVFDFRVRADPGLLLSLLEFAFLRSWTVTLWDCCAPLRCDCHVGGASGRCAED